jgi:hypothetical protein
VVVDTLVGTTVVPLVGGATVEVAPDDEAVLPGVVPVLPAVVPVLPGVVPVVVVVTSTQAMIPTVT